MVVRILGLTRGEESSPREITRNNLLSESGGESGWLIRFFDSSFFCEWIAVSYLYKHDHPGVRDYLCNRMYTLPLSGIESYLFQICYMLVHKPSPSLDKFVIDICSKSLKIALKVQWFLMAELEDSDDNDGISRIQEKCQIAATLMGEWTPLIKPQNEPTSNGGKNQVLTRLLSSKQRLLSLATSPPPQKSFSFSSSAANPSQDEGSSKASPDDNTIFKKFIPSPKVRNALLFRKSIDKDEEEPDKDGFFKRLLRDSKDEDESDKDGFFKRLLRDSKDEDESDKDGFFKRLLRDSKDEDESDKDGFFKRFLRDSKDEDVRKSVERDDEDKEKDGFFRRFLKDSKDEDEVTSSSDKFFKRIFRDNKGDLEEKTVSKSAEGDDKDGFFRKLFRDKSEEEEKVTNSVEDDEKEGFFRKIFKEKFEDKKDEAASEEGNGHANGVDEEPSDFPLFRRLFRMQSDDTKTVPTNENINGGGLESSPGTEIFFRKLFRDRDRSVEDSELYGSKKNKEKNPGSKQRNENSSNKPPLPNATASQFRKGTYHESLDFVHSLCETSYGLVDVFPVEDRKSALSESLTEINVHVAAAQSSGGVCFPMGKGMYRVVHIPEDEAVLLNSREKAPYLICVELLKSETVSTVKDGSSSQKLSRGGIPLANGDAFLPKPPPWAYPLSNGQDLYHSGYDRMSRSASDAIDQAMGQLWDSKAKFVNVRLLVENPLPCCSKNFEASNSKFDIHHCEGGKCASYPSRAADGSDTEWVRVVLTADSGVSMDDIEVQEPPRRREHRRVPSTIAFEEVKAAALKGEAPAGLPLKGTGQASSDAQPKDIDGATPKAGDALSGELWQAKKDRIRQASVYGKLPGWDLCSVIVKSGDDCRQEHLAVQLISHFYDIFQEAGLPLWLRPYEVLVTSSYTALIETIPDTASLHSIKSRFPNITSLRDFFIAKYQENSPSYKLAQRNFVESMAGYSLVCYLLQVKDRHNGNLLLDEDGHLIHIDFGFMLSNSPGGVNFESAPFKLTRELLEVMDSDAEGVPSEFFDYFKVLCIQGFLTCRKHAERIILLVEMLQDSGFPCFKGGPRTIQNLRKRFHLSLTEEQCVSLVLSLISSSLDAWRTRQYDYYQRVLNGIL
ncbi:phosphatidylinositol 4-kinase beta 1-like isoform X2 [Cynara cardunculus var. scolymus]|uniref:phosphatidylinositol 4-kinase beta 1-like isoform X2 n=1 Tax=Cynara cardunculus var. scolymus TaxID=59895 RepID=UPI000D624490|nr:phosphatidylinositol 4-kinase beta 1-like isoform X2 [Cynara cardunculus var. scolymus]